MMTELRFFGELSLLAFDQMAGPAVVCQLPSANTVSEIIYKQSSDLMNVMLVCKI